MKLLITDKPIHHDYVISGSVINGIDLSVFPAGAIFRGNDSTDAAGIYNVELIDGELYVTLGQHGRLTALTIGLGQASGSMPVILILSTATSSPRLRPTMLST